MVKLVDVSSWYLVVLMVMTEECAKMVDNALVVVDSDTNL